MTNTVTIAAATVVVAGAAMLQTLQPETWVSLFRAQLARKTDRRGAIAGLLVGLIGQAATTAVVALFVTILILSVVAAADERLHVWAGVTTVALSGVFFVRHWRSEESAWTRAAELIRAVGSGASGTADPYGRLDQSASEIIRNAILSPRFILAPMFLAASASGQPGIGNALPLIIVYALFSVVGLVWLVRCIGNGTDRYAKQFLVKRMNLLVGVAVVLLGVVTAIEG